MVLLQVCFLDHRQTLIQRASSSAIIPFSSTSSFNDLAVSLRNIFDSDLFGVRQNLETSGGENVEPDGVQFTVKWVSGGGLQDLVLAEGESVKRAFTLMKARGWRDALVATCTVKSKG